MALTGVLRPGHAQVRVLNLEESIRFYRDVLGLVETGRDAQGRVYFKCWDERDHHSYVIREADSAGLDFLGFKVLDKATLERLEADLRAYGLQTTRLPAGDLLETGERVRFELPSGHLIELYAEKTIVGNGVGLINPAPWDGAREHGIAPVRLDHALLYGPNIAEVQKIFTEVLGFYLVERVLTPDGQDNAAIWLSCSHKVHDIAFAEYPEKGKLHHCSFLLDTWEQVLRAGDIMSMNQVAVDIGPTRHGVTRGCTIYAWDPSGNRFETFMGGYQPYPDYEPLTWTFDNFGQGLDFPQRKLHETFLSVVT
ncbi:catechol 2,3-dioxygenase, LapB [Azotobacter vinelandii CA]|uniref:Metapyrocatechase n=2 Tax=Azotobacter vinelandii TaxID=354 RepID=C1DN75_AZOVD|nr:catechol 2,3-dioxygenase [Azotobacter vinelandii]ACO79242.1 catechol 2,3-dioxygenase, LapB [Azotobacter vinelandii DJ]AGK13654.1 catechol 2,3-dioxygenase, LapB [Azotobacter vinelandii CA]AGK18177.1 catechol 2,3-dioxygenase, LapB [Azotobacter vinelandii CA6]SFX96297.1 catechol 2,3-dioxygenase [Azotobacter vinelandii]GLK61145.1 catechol 2,3-dioxygenase [Azotobacter vinelandii]